MVPSVKHYDLPLLPFEHDLIQIAGITEQEYRFFAAEAMRMARVSPAEYRYIPEVRMELTTILINLAIGLALSAASYLLTPKPKAPSAGDRVKQRQLANVEGLSAFAPTSGFDSQAQVASYGEPIPLLFGRYTGATGGMLFSPKLVWSRAFSYGTQQGVKLLFVVAEQGTGTTGIDKPDLQGIFLGNTPLDAAFAHTFAFYWRSGTFNGTSRIKSINLRYGSRATADSGDPETNDDVFLAPTRESLADPAFCNAYSLSSNSEFGVFAPIYNGSDYRVNWRIVSIPQLDSQPDDPEGQLIRDRVKIAGDYGIGIGTGAKRREVRLQYQKGTGRGYSRRMGITSHNGYSITSSGADTEVRQVNVGDTCVFTIVPNKLPKDFYYGDNAKNTQVDDINSEIDTQRATADSRLQLGETFQIGYTIWKVIGRTLDIWQAGQTQSITLQCVELLGFGGLRRQIGIVNMRVLTADVVADNATSVPISFYPLMRTQIATVRNTRPCDATEIGIKSQIWNRANGLCNFNSLPSPDELRKAEAKQVQLTSGTMNLYFKRTSAFAIQFRPAGTDDAGNEYAWSAVGNGFCITGEQPTDAYNFLRFVHPDRRQYEYRLIPRSGADTIRHMSATEELWQLDARRTGGTGATLSQTYSTSYGNLTVFGAGRMVKVADVEFNEEMATDASSTAGSSSSTVPQSVAVYSWYPDNLGFEVEIIRQAFKWELFGPYYKSGGGSYDLNEIATTEVTYTVGSRTLRIRWSAQLVANTGGTLFPVQAFGRLWGPLTWEVVTASSTGVWTVGETFNVAEDLDVSNPLRGSLPGVRVEGETTGVFFGPRIRVDSLVTVSTSAELTAERIFERNSQLADVSFYSSLLQKSNESSPEFAISYVNEIVDNDGTPNYDNLVLAGLALKASRTYSSLDQVRMWKDDGMPVTRFHPDEAGSVGPSNLLTDLIYYLLTDKVAGAGNVISPAQIKTGDFAATARFLRTNGLFFDGAITDPSNVRELITQLAPFFLCNFVIADGLFSVVPALPTTASGAISTDAVPISALFTGGNILENTFSVEYLSSEERNSIQAVMRYRKGLKNQLPEEKTLTVRWNEANAAAHRIESFDLTQYCTSRSHALLAAKFLLSVRRRITHTVRFKTTPYGLALAPGKFIRVVTQASPYSGANNGVIGESGAITSITPLADGNYSVIYYKPPATAVQSATLTVSGGVTAQADLFGSVFTVTTASTSSNVYMVEQLTLDEDGMVEIVASEFPTDSGYRSRIAEDVLSSTAFTTEG